MNILSLSTLHKEYLPQAYTSSIQPLWCGFGTKEEYYISSKLLAYVPYIQRYKDDVTRYALHTQNPIEDTLYIDTEDESISLLQESIEHGSLPVQENDRDKQYYKILSLAYLLEEQEHDIQEEYINILESYSDLQQYIPHLHTLESQIQYSSHSHVANTIKAILYYCKEYPQIIFASHSEAVESFLSPYITYAEIPQDISALLNKYNLISCYKGYIPDTSMITELADIRPTAQRILILEPTPHISI